MEKIRILLKMIWYNRKNYILYLVCNIFIFRMKGNEDDLRSDEEHQNRSGRYKRHGDAR